MAINLVLHRHSLVALWMLIDTICGDAFARFALQYGFAKKSVYV